jgi:multicomponent K+:H+ antiporter subunit A
MPITTLLFATIGIPFLGGLVAAFLPTNARNAEAWLAGAIALIDVAILAFLYPLVTEGNVVRAEIEWIPSAGLNFVVRLDGFAWMFALLIASVGFLVVLYARYYMSPADPVPRLFSFMLAFMGSMLGVVLSGNLVQLVFFWELTSLFSFLLIGYWHHNASAREGARVALIVTASGGFCLFAGVLLLGHIVGSYDLDRVLASGDLIRSHDLYLPALVLILLGALTKSAQFPFHFWLPRAMAAPTPVSAYLHSATMVKAGVFLLARLWPVMAGTDYWLWIVGSAGLVTFVLGAFLALFQQDLKGILAYSTISHLGLITLLLGLDTPLAIVAAIFHMMNHATFKASLFMAAGIIDHETGTRDIRRLSGLYHFMPVTATLAMVAAAAMAGVPLLNGFLSKEMFFAETISTHDGSLVDDALPYVATLAAVFSVAYSLRFILDVFFGPPPVGLPRTPHEPPHWMRFPVELLVVVCLVVGIFPVITIGPFLHTAVVAVLGLDSPAYSLALWHGFTLPLLMSVIALIGGVTLYAVLHTYMPGGIVVPVIHQFTGKPIFGGGLGASVRWLLNLLSTRRLQPQLRLLVCVAILAALGPLYGRNLMPERFDLSAIDIAFALVWLVGIVCAVATAYQAKYHRLAALILMGGVGLVTCITFVWLSAPDLALTQLLVEIVTTVLILLGLRWLPMRREEIAPRTTGVVATRLGRLRDLAIALAAGAGLSTIAYAMMVRSPPDGISRFFLERAQTEGGGANVVNVILVDFRGYDTLGEITVLGVVAIAVYALLRRFRPALESIDIPMQQRVQNAYDIDHPERQMGDTIADYLMVPSVIMRMLFPVIATMAVFLLLRGHDLPGGGFVAGLTMAVGIILQYMAGGATWIETRFRISPVRWMAMGLLFATATGAGAWLVGYPFLTSHMFDINLPVIGVLHLSSVYLFDLGVFSLVFGATVLMLIALAHQSLRSHRRPKAAASEATGRE